MPLSDIDTHTLPFKIPTIKGGRAYWSTKPDGTIIVFVHGFTGSAESTWQQFPTLLQQDSRTNGTDLIFYQYDSTKKRAPLSAGNFENFLIALFKDSTRFIVNNHGKPLRTTNINYTKIILVGHSLGGVICRQALINATYNNLPWIKQTNIILFSPAHLGATSLKFVRESIANSLFSSVLSLVASYKSPVLKDLEPNSSFLTQLLNQSIELQSDNMNSHLIASKVIFGDDDKVVEPLQFNNAPPHLTIKDKNHTTVFKPNEIFNIPLELIL